MALTTFGAKLRKWRDENELTRRELSEDVYKRQDLHLIHRHHAHCHIPTVGDKKNYMCLHQSPFHNDYKLL